jgi:hypothetical protein
MRTPILARLAKYNDRFLATSAAPIEIISWEKNGPIIILSTGISLTKQEATLFTSRANSRNLDMLHIMGEGYSIVDIEKRNLFFTESLRKAASRKQLAFLASITPELREQRKQQALHAQTLRKNTKPRLGISPWNKGQTKHTNNMLRQISAQRSGTGNPMYGTTMSDDAKVDKSNWLKDRIASGEWTPHVHNSRTHFESKCDGKAFRSSWEAMFQTIHSTAEYEKIRIPYVFNGRHHTYIVDFIDPSKQVLYEIRPTERSTDLKSVEKFAAARNWATENKYEFVLITQQYFVENFQLIDFSRLDIPNLSVKLRAIKNAAEKKTRNTQTTGDVQSPCTEQS